MWYSGPEKAKKIPVPAWDEDLGKCQGHHRIAGDYWVPLIPREKNVNYFVRVQLFYVFPGLTGVETFNAFLTWTSLSVYSVF